MQQPLKQGLSGEVLVSLFRFIFNVQHLKPCDWSIDEYHHVEDIFRGGPMPAVLGYRNISLDLTKKSTQTPPETVLRI